ncbi:hypothetical protein DS742_09455 [Lacrimispora amygdalina]|uniref:DUF4362 domain-containing protein n=2 Tax=Lacrimispora amygdalina TaxID=253257 RepID=A0A3E2NDY7_9FIRM|nr:hypothetical protein DS742_09455 [Clostridium indicum]
MNIIMKRRVITIALLLSLTAILGGCNKSQSVVNNIENTSSPVETTAKVSTNENNSITQTKSSTVLTMTELLNKLQGEWYNLNDENSISENGVQRSIMIEKEENDYTLVDIFPDTALSYKVSSIQYLGNNNSYLITTHNGDDQNNIGFTFNISDDFKSINITSDYDKDVKYVKATDETKQYVQMLQLVGTYKDDQNKEYVFKDGGIATWPNETFKFSVSFIEKIFPNSSPSKEVYNYIIVNDNNGKETMRYLYEIIGNKLTIYKTALDKENNYIKGALVVTLTKSNGTTDLIQKAIDIVGKKYNAVVDYKVESGVMIYKSDIGEISIDCSGPDKTNKYKVSIFKESASSSDIFKEFNVDVISGSVEEIK